MGHKARPTPAIQEIRIYCNGDIRVGSGLTEEYSIAGRCLTGDIRLMRME